MTDTDTEQIVPTDTSYGNGKSLAAIRRRFERNRGKLHAGRPGDLIEMSRGRKYRVADDGSFRRIAA